MGASRITILAACALAASGCTVVQVGEGARVAMIRPGVLQIAPAPGAAMVAYRAQGIGLVPGRGGATLGWSSETAALLYDPAQCRIVVLASDPRADAFWRDLKHAHPDICLAGEKP